MRIPNDILLAREVDGIDLILGGHDHHKFNEFVNGKWIIKSGTDFKSLSLIEVGKKEGANETYTVNKIECFEVDSKLREDSEVKQIVKEFNNLNMDSFNRVLGNIDTELDCRFKTVRSKESKLGNFISDIVKVNINADCSIINSGTLRSDCIFSDGDFTFKDLSKIIVFPDPIVLLLCTGKLKNKLVLILKGNHLILLNY